jgi:hypothetical protein
MRTGLPDSIFSNQKSNLGKFWSALQWKMLVILCTYFLSILRPFDIFYGNFVYFVVVWYIFPRVGKFYQEKSGNLA